jgi:putative hydrolase of the HAD superfamily
MFRCATSAGLARGAASGHIEAMPRENGPVERDLAAIDTWIFDLDNTLYRLSPRMMAEIDGRMRAFVAEFLGVDLEEARRVQKDYFRRYGLTLRGLMVNHGLDPARYAASLVELDLSDVIPDPVLTSAITRLPGRKIIYTNAFSDHTRRMLEHLRLTVCFDCVHDIEAAGYLPKPSDEAFAELVRRQGIAPERTVFVDDVSANLAPAARLGMTTVWVRTGAEWAKDVAPGQHIHHTVDDLRAWIAARTADR